MVYWWASTQSMISRSARSVNVHLTVGFSDPTTANDLLSAHPPPHRLVSPLVALGLVLAGCAAPPAPTFAGTPFYVPGSHFTVIGDLQGTLPEEQMIGRENNDLERWQLLPEVARTNPAFVVMLGDLVSWGASAAEWDDFDEHTDALRRMGIPVFAVPGNHDYFGGDRLRHYFAPLPTHSRFALVRAPLWPTRHDLPGQQCRSTGWRRLGRAETMVRCRIGAL